MQLKILTQVQSPRPPKGNSLRKNTSSTYRSPKSVHPFLHSSPFYPTHKILHVYTVYMQTRRSASADRTARRQFQATGQPVSRTQASDTWRHGCRAMRRSVCNAGASNAFRYEGNGATPCQYIDITRKTIDCATTLPLRVLYLPNETLQQTFRLYCRNCPKDDKFRYFIPILRKLGAA